MSLRDIFAALRCSRGQWDPAATQQMRNERPDAKRGARYYVTPCGDDITDADLSSAVTCAEWQDAPFGAIIGRAAGRVLWHDFQTTPHLLIAGNTGSGKSVCLNSIISSLLCVHSPATMGLILIDPKRVELASYAGLPHLLQPLAKSANDAENALSFARDLMFSRYERMEQKRVKNADALQLRHILVIFDEYASLASKAENAKRLQPIIADIARLGRAANVHLILATQYPTARVIDTQIRSNIDGRIAFRLKNKVESKVVLDMSGAETLRGRGDGLHQTSDGMTHFKGLFVSDQQIDSLVDYWKQEERIKRYG